jgi:hypothetical protein
MRTKATLEVHRTSAESLKGIVGSVGLVSFSDLRENLGSALQNAK